MVKVFQHSWPHAGQTIFILFVYVSARGFNGLRGGFASPSRWGLSNGYSAASALAMGSAAPAANKD